MSKLKLKQKKADAFLDRIREGKHLMSLPTLSSKDQQSFFAKNIQIETSEEKNVIFKEVTFDNYFIEKPNLVHWSPLLQRSRKYNTVLSGEIGIIHYGKPIDNFVKSTCNCELFIQVSDYRNKPGFKVYDSFSYISTIHLGSYDDLIKTYTYLLRWAVKEKITLQDKTIHYYIISPADTDHEEEYVTKILFPIQE